MSGRAGGSKEQEGAPKRPRSSKKSPEKGKDGRKRTEEEKQKAPKQTQTTLSGSSHLFDLGFPPIEGNVVSQSTVVNQQLMCGGNVFEVRPKTEPEFEPIRYDAPVMIDPTDIGGGLVIYKTPKPGQSTRGADEFIIVVEKVAEMGNFARRNARGMDLDMMGSSTGEYGAQGKEAEAKEDSGKCLGGLFSNTIQRNDESGHLAMLAEAPGEEKADDGMDLDMVRSSSDENEGAESKEAEVEEDSETSVGRLFSEAVAALQNEDENMSPGLLAMLAEAPEEEGDGEMFSE